MHEQELIDEFLKEPELLPLTELMQYGSYPGSTEPAVSLLSSSSSKKEIRLRVAVFFTSIIAGCNCSDDPGRSDEIQEYGECELIFDHSYRLLQVIPL
jgi:hypothetical protein